MARYPKRMMQGNKELMRSKYNIKSLQNFNQNIQYEWLEFNQEGSYASSTIIGMNTRREHGLLNVYDLKKNSHLSLLSKLEESVFIDTRLYELSTNQYEDDIFPHGFNYLEAFQQDPFPTFIFKIEDRVIKKTLFLLHDKNVLVVRYELKNQGNSVKLVVKPFLSARDTHSLAKDNSGLNTDSYLGQSFVRFVPRNDFPELNVIYNQGEFLPASLWYHKFKYFRDENRYPAGNEDLFNPGFFQTRLKPYETLDLYFSTEEPEALDTDYEALYREELTLRTGQKNDNGPAEKLLHLSLPHKDGLLVSYLDSDTSLRKTMLSMPLFLYTADAQKKFKTLFRQLLAKLDNGLLPLNMNGGQSTIPSMAADTPLWLFILAHNYLTVTGDTSFFTMDILDSLKSIIHAFIRGTAGNIYMNKNGLIFSGNKEIQSSLLPLNTSDHLVLRYGFLPEVNALWYNALRIMSDLFRAAGKQRMANKYEKNSKKTRKSFNTLFVDKETQRLYDYVHHQHKGKDFRFLQIIPLSLPYPVLDEEHAQALLSLIDEQLVTPYGLRLSARETGELKQVSGTEQILNPNAIWVWPVSCYIQASLRYKAGNPHLKADLKKYFQPLQELESDGLLGFYPEAVLINKNIHSLGSEDSFLSMANIALTFHLLQD